VLQFQTVLDIQWW